MYIYSWKWLSFKWTTLRQKKQINLSAVFDTVESIKMNLSHHCSVEGFFFLSLWFQQMRKCLFDTTMWKITNNFTTYPMNSLDPRDQKVMELFEYFERHSLLAPLWSLLVHRYRNAVQMQTNKLLLLKSNSIDKKDLAQDHAWT